MMVSPSLIIWAAACPDGVWLAELAPVSTPDLVVTTVAEALRIPLAPDRPAIDVLVEALRGTSALLIIDNCEHLRAPASQLIHVLLQRCPNVVVRPLHVAASRGWPVVDRAGVDEGTGLVDDVHVRSVGGAVHLTDGAGGIEQHGGEAGPAPADDTGTPPVTRATARRTSPARDRHITLQIVPHRLTGASFGRIRNPAHLAKMAATVKAPT